jgi:hypothetical protein
MEPVRQGESFFYSERLVVVHGLIMSGIGLASPDVERVVTRSGGSEMAIFNK